MKISIIFLFIISFLTVMCPSPGDIYCNGVRNGCYRGCSHKGHSAMSSCRSNCDSQYYNCKKNIAEA